MTGSLGPAEVHADPVRRAVDDERHRFARDVHDILGPSLVTIRVKAELAEGLLDTDLARARSVLLEIPSLTRDAIAEVRRAVQGYRDIDLAEELVRARSALAAAGIEAAVPSVPVDEPPELSELFAWTIREGVTNVIRHSGASRCTVVLAPGRVEVHDDGHQPREVSPGGFGLVGLRERAAGAGATVVTRARPGGFSLEVYRGP